MKTTLLTIAALGLTMMIPATQATPMVGTIGAASNYTVIHTGSNPGGTGDSADWGWFQAGQQINLDLDNGILTLDGPQSFTMGIGGAESLVTADVTFLDMTLNLNDTDGFSGGFLSYTTEDVQYGVFGFSDQNYSSIFNTSSQSGNALDVFVWGGDGLNGLGIDLGFSLVVPEPAMVALLALGLVMMTLLVTRRQPLVVQRQD